MADPFIGEIRIFPYTFAPMSWSYCDGGTVPYSQNPALAAIIGNIYGGTPNQTIGLPDLRGQAVLGAGSGPGLTTYEPNDSAGVTSVTLTSTTCPTHNHLVAAANVNATAGASVVSGYLAKGGTQKGKTFSPYPSYAPGGPNTTLSNTAVSVAGASAPAAHENRQPYLVVPFCIALEGIWPPRP